MHATVLVASLLLAAPFQAISARTNTDPVSDTKCRQDIRAVNDQADVDIRDNDRLIALLENEIGDRAIASGEQSMQDRLRARLADARTHRSDILDKQRDDLSALRDRCDPRLQAVGRGGADPGARAQGSP